jgi:hypothetical protein
MRKDRFITTFLLLLLAMIITSSVARLHGLGQQPTLPKPTAGRAHSLGKQLSAVKTKQEWDALLSKLPTVDYEAPESNKAENLEQRRVKTVAMISGRWWLGTLILRSH